MVKTSSIDSKLRQRNTYEDLLTKSRVTKHQFDYDLVNLNKNDFRKKYRSILPRKNATADAYRQNARVGLTLQSTNQLKQIKQRARVKPRKPRVFRNRRYVNTTGQTVQRNTKVTSLSRMKQSWELKGGVKGKSFQQVQIRKGFIMMQKINGECIESSAQRKFITGLSGISKQKTLLKLYGEAEQDLLQKMEDLDERYKTECIYWDSQMSENTIVWRYIK